MKRKQNIGVRAKVGDIVHIRYYSEIGRGYIAGLAVEVRANGLVVKMEAFDGQVHSMLGTADIIVTNRAIAKWVGLDFDAALAALKRRGGKRFRTRETAQKFLMPFLHLKATSPQVTP